MITDQSNVLADFTFVDRYAQYLPEKKRRENWKESTARVRKCFEDYYRKKLGTLDTIQEYLDDAMEGMEKQEALPSQRMLQFAGDAVLRRNARLNNCWASFIDRPRFFQEAMWILLCGGGTGFSAQKHHIAKLPNIALPVKGDKTYVIPDSIEGWADSIGVLVSSYFTSDQPFPEFAGHTVQFDYSKIRPKGSSFSHGVGVAPGPDGLRVAHLRINHLLQNCAAIRNKLRPIDAYDVVMHSSDAVLSGGIRRSASICIFSFDDEDMMNAKTGTWFRDNPQRGRSNNSALIIRDSISFDDFNTLIHRTRDSGEPGFFFSDSEEHVPNPCLTGDTLVATKDGYKRIDEMYRDQNNFIYTDNRILKDGISESFGVTLREASQVELTQRNAPIYKIETHDGHVIRATANHIFPTVSGRKRVDHLNFQDVLYGVDLNKACDISVAPAQYRTRIKSVVMIGYEDVYCLKEPITNSFIANGLCVGNCAEINFRPIQESTNFTGWQACNLSTQNGKKIHTAEDFYRTARRAAIFGTLQAGMDNFEYLGPVTESIVRREALIGVSMTGMFTNPDVLFDPTIQRRAAQIIKETNKKLAAILGINAAARTTAIKPEGTSTTMLGLVAFAGCHPGKGGRVLRRVQCNELSDPMRFYKTRNPHAVEPSVWGSSGTDENVIFYCESPEGSIQESDISPIDFLEKIRSTQLNYINEGTNVEFCTDPRLRNNVSNTVAVGPNDWETVARYIYDHRYDFTAVSLIPKTGFRDFAQAPFVTVFDENELSEMYGENWHERSSGGQTTMFDKSFHWLTQVEHKTLWETLYNFTHSRQMIESLCGVTSKDLSVICKYSALLKVDKSIIEHFVTHRGIYMNIADVLTTNDTTLEFVSNMLKDIHTHYFAKMLTANHRPVNFDDMVELENHTLGTGEIACGNGACLI